MRKCRANGLLEHRFQRLLAPRGERQNGQDEALGSDVVIKPAMVQETAERFEGLVNDTPRMGVVVHKDDPQPKAVAGSSTKKGCRGSDCPPTRKPIWELVRIEPRAFARLISVEEPREGVAGDLSLSFQRGSVLG